MNHHIHDESSKVSSEHCARGVVPLNRTWAPGPFQYVTNLTPMLLYHCTVEKGEIICIGMAHCGCSVLASRRSEIASVELPVPSASANTSNGQG